MAEKSHVLALSYRLRQPSDRRCKGISCGISTTREPNVTGSGLCRFYAWARAAGHPHCRWHLCTDIDGALGYLTDMLSRLA